MIHENGMKFIIPTWWLHSTLVNWWKPYNWCSFAMCYLYFTLGSVTKLVYRLYLCKVRKDMRLYFLLICPMVLYTMLVLPWYCVHARRFVCLFTSYVTSSMFQCTRRLCVIYPFKVSKCQLTDVLRHWNWTTGFRDFTAWRVAWQMLSWLDII